MIAIRRCCICKKEFEAESGVDSNVMCEDCRLFGDLWLDKNNEQGDDFDELDGNDYDDDVEQPFGEQPVRDNGQEEPELIQAVRKNLNQYKSRHPDYLREQRKPVSVKQHSMVAPDSDAFDPNGLDEETLRYLDGLPFSS